MFFIVRPSTILDRQFCHCGLHLAFSRSRIGMLNDASRNMVFFESLKQVSFLLIKYICSMLLFCIFDYYMLSFDYGTLNMKYDINTFIYVYPEFDTYPNIRNVYLFLLSLNLLVLFKQSTNVLIHL